MFNLICSFGASYESNSFFQKKFLSWATASRCSWWDFINHFKLKTDRKNWRPTYIKFGRHSRYSSLNRHCEPQKAVTLEVGSGKMSKLQLVQKTSVYDRKQGAQLTALLPSTPHSWNCHMDLIWLAALISHKTPERAATKGSKTNLSIDYML